ncbi:putative F420-0 ABC transporter substrate-binding protein [Ruania suaedae]|uniref:putative F420-0 ABC transporter substrate-binding protein n=1 Tax=Ruania suaedae TaxID=2897774 RepID=UPI001E422F7C|nr:putative F420-0 ABC transporter substrate-binding protein [Ruania suaedae]UFU04108.1 putative F420-0 ABC transporter substrate-binding protein [Ruania suaedae]
MPSTRSTLASVALVLGLAGCSGGASADPDPSASAGAPSAASGTYPVTVDNCGTEVTVAEAPERIVTIKSTSTEMVLALGLGDRLVGTAFSDGPLPGDLAGTGADAPVLAERAPSEEVVLETEPDLVFAGWESNFSADGAGVRADLQQLGITTYVSPAACQAPEYQPDPLTFDDVFASITEAGDLLGAPDAAAELVADQQQRLEGIEASGSGLTALWYSSGSDTPFVGGGIGAPQLLMETAGLSNIMAGTEETWASASWEAIAEENPDVIVLVDSAWNTAEHKIEVLESTPTTAVLPAVQEERYLIVPFPASEAGVRSVDAAADLATQLDELESTTAAG